MALYVVTGYWEAGYAEGEDAAQPEITQGGTTKKRRRVSFNPAPVDLYELFKVEQNNLAIILEIA